MTITFSLVQSASNQADPGSPTFGATPTENNLLLAFGAERSGTGSGPATITGTGWSKEIARDVLLADGTYRRSLSCWWKVAGTSEPTNVQYDDGTANSKMILLTEWTAGVPVTWAFDDAVDNDNGAVSNATVLSTGTTASLSAAVHALIGVAYIKQGIQSDAFSSTWASSSLTQVAAAQGGSSGRTILVALGQDATSGTKTTTGTVSAGTIDNAGLVYGLIVFSAVETAPDPSKGIIRNVLRPGPFKPGIAR